MKREYLRALNPISLADIVLLLIIFFLLTSTYVLEPGIRVRLPKTRFVEAVTEREARVSITREGRLFLNDQPVTFSNLGVNLEQLLPTLCEPVLIIRADKDVRVDMLVRVMDIARGAGYERFLIATRPAE